MISRPRWLLLLGAVPALTACAHLTPAGATAAARRNVCGPPGSAGDAACETPAAAERVAGGYRVVVERRPPAGSDRVAVVVRRHGRRIDVTPLDSVAPAPR